VDVRELNVGLSDLFSRQPKRFVSQKAFEENLKKQLALTPQTLQQLRTYNVTPEKRRKLEFFFYTNTVEKAAALAAELTNKNYEVEHRPSASNAKIQIVTGWTIEVTMSDKTVLDWTRDMCNLGFTHDCDFDGWGTNAD
jgi:regulator of RNase E activity RraB